MEDSLTQNEVVIRFGINLTPMVRFQDTAQSMLCSVAKISQTADLEICYFNIELAIELYDDSLSVYCLVCH